MQKELYMDEVFKCKVSTYLVPQDEADFDRGSKVREKEAAHFAKVDAAVADAIGFAQGGDDKES